MKPGSELANEAWSRVTINRLNDRLAELAPLLNIHTDLTSPIQILIDSNGVYISIDQATLVNAAPPAARDFNFYKTPVGRWFGSNVTTPECSVSNLNIGRDYMIATPFLTMQTRTVTQIAFELQHVGDVGDRAQVGIYTNLGDLQNYPAALLTQGTAFDVHAPGFTPPGLCISFLGAGVTLLAGALYWLVFATNIRSTTSQFTFLAGSSIHNVLGFEDGQWLNSGPGETGASYGYITSSTSAYTYGDTLPKAFPGSGNLFPEEASALDDAPMVQVRMDVTGGAAGGGGGNVAVNCCTQTVAPATWQMTIAGVTNNSCVTCTGYNGTFKITFQGGCVWQSGVGFANPCGGGFATLQLICDSGNSRFLLTINGGGGAVAAQYILAQASWTPLGNNVMTLLTNDGECSTWPATITLSPA